ncbi:MAG: tRNA ((6))-methyltransferase TrmN6 [Polyangiaceae bacterium]|nr:tRNA ((6))-methyltransferase TrmN6 [Polyangiaceae bacterium]
MASAAATTTTDTLLGGALRLLQPKVGYRVNVDSLLLVAFAGTRRVERVVDLGAGVGALGLLALTRGIAKQALLVEADPKLVALANENLRRGAFQGEAVELDLTRHKLHRSAAPLVLCNPPYYPAHSHRPAQSPGKARSRSGDVTPFLTAASAIVSRKTGRALFSYPAQQLPELLAAATEVGLVAKRLRFVHARADEPARLALVELRAARPGGLVVEPPLIEWIGRARSPELAALTAERASDRR